LTLSVYASHPRAQRVYEKAGFVLDSVDEAELAFEGDMIDSLNMILTRATYKIDSKVRPSLKPRGSLFYNKQQFCVFVSKASLNTCGALFATCKKR